MNHHYRIVWSQVSNTWIAVSEISKGHGKSTSARKRVVSALALLGLSALSMASSALDLPTGAQVTAGAASVQTPVKGSLVVNQSTQRAVIKWNDFSIGQGKQVTFAQPNAGAATLNVVTGNGASSIAGTLKSNGSVYLINQNGIAITPTGLVDTRAGFIASTLRMDENAFMNGKYLFSGKGGSVVNRGQILTGSGGTVGLLGSTVANEGLISAPLGKVALGSGEAATLDLSGDGFLQVMLPTSAVGADGQALVTNSGVIQADGGMVMLKAATVRQALREAVNMPGAISARSVSGKNGAIVLEGGAGGTVRVTGALSADGDTTGGRIDVAGANVTLEGASLSATGAERGGLVRVGGAFQGGREQPADSENAALFAGRFGSSPAITNATTTSIDAASSINVSATGPAGTGGTAIVWSDSTTVMQGAIAARGAVSGGAVEVSAKSTVQSVDLKRIDLGKGGNLLIDPQDIVIDHVAPADTAESYSYAAPGTITHLLDTDLTALLSTGATVSLQASQDINWLNNFTFVTRTSTTPGGNLNLSAGRSVTLSGIFTTADGNWSIVANDTAAHGVVDAERGAGDANIDVGHANFINSNGNLSLTLADGAGNSNNGVGFIWLGKFNGNGLSAEITSAALPDAVNRGIWLSGDINVSGTISLTGNLQVVQENPLLSLSGHRVTWTNEKTGGTIDGYNAIKFIENDVTTRFGQLSGSDAVRLGLGDSPVLGLTRIYGDSDPDIANVLALTSPLHVAAHSATTVAPDPLGAIFSADSLSASGPGVFAAAGSHNMTLSATNNLAFASGLSSGYFVDLTPVTIPLTIIPRTLTPTVSAGAYIYGSPVAVASLAGVVNGDVINPVATLNGTVGVNMVNSGAGFRFAETVAAGTASFSLTGLFGAKASNYTLDLNGVTGSTLAITPKALNYVAGSGRQTYGALGSMPSASLSGIVAGDDVAPVVALNAAGQAVSLTDRLPAGAYASDVGSLTGSKAGNYSVAVAGNISGQYVVDPKSLAVTYNASPVMSTYGTQTTLEAPTLSGILSGDTVTGSFGAADSWSGAPVALTPTTPAGNYSKVVTGLSGASSSNYVLAGGNNYGSLSIAKKTLTYSNSNSSQVYGQLTLPSPTLNGIVGTDSISAVQRITTYPLSFNLAGESGAYPVGNYGVDLVALTGVSSANYTLAESGNTPNQVAVTAKAVTFSLASANSTYGTNAVLPTVNLSGIVSGDVVAAGPVVAIGNGAAALNASTAAGNYTLGIQGLTGNGVANNYRLDSTGNTTGALTIAPKTLTWAVASDTVAYGNALTNATTLNGLVGGDSVASSIAAFDANGAVLTRPNVGTYGVGVTSLAGPLASNYVLASSGNTMGSVSIGPRPLTYTVAPTHSVYGTLAQDGAVVLNNVLPGDNVGTATLGYQVASAPVTLTERSPVGTYTSQVKALTGGNPNYVVASTGNTDGVLTIAPKPVTFNTPNASSIYGTAAVLDAGTLSGVLAGDAVQPGATTLATGLSPLERQDAGSYALITPSLSGAQAGNYTIAATGSTSGVLDIAPKPLTYSLKVYWADRLLTDAVTYGEVHPFNGHTGFETIPIGWAWYGGVTSFPGVVRTLSGVLTGDDVSLKVNSPNLPVSTSGAYTVGTYRWTGGALSSSNYVLAATGNTDKALTILPRVLSGRTVGNANDVWSQNSVVYGSTAGAVPAINFNLGDRFDPFFNFPLNNVDQVSAAAEYVTPQGHVGQLAERQAVGEYQVVMKGGLTGADAGNYIATPGINQGKFLVYPKTVTVQFPDLTKTYGEQTGMPSPVLSGVLPGDSLGATISINGNANFVLDSRAPVGLYAIDLVGKTGADAGNYFIKGMQTDFAKYYWPNHSENLARLKILPKKLTVVGGIQNFALTYGDTITVNHMYIDGVLPGDNVQITPKAVPWDRAQPQQDINGVRLNAGTYTIGAALSGDASSNYTFATYGLGFGRIDVAKFKLPELTDTRTVTYGDWVNWNSQRAQGVGGDVIFVNSRLTSGGRGVSTRNGFEDAGYYTLEFVAQFGPTWNYDFPSSQPVRILPRELTWQPTAASTITYGATTPINLGTLSGMFPWDDVNIKTATIGSLTDRALIPDKTFWADQKTYSFADQLGVKRLNAGQYSMPVTTGGLVGAQRGNYVLPPMKTPLDLNVVPKVITYSVRDTKAQYGNYAVCSGLCFHLWEPDPLNYHLVTLDGVLNDNKFAGSTWNVEPGVKGSIGVIDANGVSSAMTATTPLGRYRMGVSGLTGPYAKNYQIDQARSHTGELEIVPMWLTYTTTSAIYLPGPGLIGKPGIPTLQGPNGTPINGDDVKPIVGVSDPSGKEVFNLSELTEGRYSFRVKELSGRDAANYRISTLTPFSSERYAKNNVGTLDVFADTRFGMRDTSIMAVPTVPHYDPPVPSPRATRPSLPSVAVDTRTGTQTGTSTTLGVATLSEESKASAGASAGAGSSGAKAQADANVETKLTADFGDGSISVGGKAGASADVSVGKDGAKVGAETSASVNVEGGGGGSAGPVGDVDGKGTLEVKAGAKGEGTATIKDGKITTGGDLSAGVGASATGQFGVSGSVGSADATATLVSPGSVGGSGSASAGYSDGAVSVSMNLGAKLGIGGFNLKLDFSINLGDIVGELEDAFKPLTDFFGGSSKPDRVGDAFRTAESLKGDPLRRLAFLQQNSDWKKYDKNAISDSERDLSSFQALLEGYPKLIAYQQSAQETMLQLLKTDPAAAIRYAHDNEFSRQTRDREDSILRDAQSLGLKFVVDGTSTTLANL